MTARAPDLERARGATGVLPLSLRAGGLLVGSLCAFPLNAGPLLALAGASGLLPLVSPAIASPAFTPAPLPGTSNPAALSLRTALLSLAAAPLAAA